MRKTVSVVVPVFNNAPTLEETCRQILHVHESAFKHLGLEIIFVNDGSKDDSWQELLRLKGLYADKVSLVNLSRNFGQVAALFAGFNRTRGDAVINVSADLQDPISLMGRMVAHWEGGSDLVIGYRENRSDGVIRRMFSRIAYRVARISCPELPRGGFDYWLMSRRVCDLLCSLKGRHNFLHGELMNVGFTRTFIPYTRVQRKVGKSSYTIAKKVKIFIDFLVDSSYVPLRFMSALGALTACSGLAYSMSITYGWWTHRTPFPGWAPIMIMLMVIGGIIMIMLGVIGEYIWRMYDNIKDYPFFIVSEESLKDNIAGSRKEAAGGASPNVIPLKAVADANHDRSSREANPAGKLQTFESVE